MESKKKLIYLEIILIITLILICIVIEYRTNNFKRDCKIEYKINDSCPCKQTKFNQTNKENMLFEPINFTLPQLK